MGYSSSGWVGPVITVLAGWVTPVLAGGGGGTPVLARGHPDWGAHPLERTWDQRQGYPPTNGQTGTCETVPSRRTTCAGGKIFCVQFCFAEVDPDREAVQKTPQRRNEHFLDSELIIGFGLRYLDYTQMDSQTTHQIKTNLGSTDKKIDTRM